MESMRVVKMKNGKYAIQTGYEVSSPIGNCSEETHIEWDFEHVSTPEKWERLLFTTEHDANKHVQAWVDENQISEICMEVYINEER